jgi:hypothetical protein
MSTGSKARPGSDADHSRHLVPRSMSTSYATRDACMANSGTAWGFYVD